MDEVRRQGSIATRDQLRSAGFTSDEIRAHLDARRWRALNEVVICTHNGPLTTRQAWWAVVLSAQGPAALCSLTALESYRINGFDAREIHILVIRGARVLAVPGIRVKVHESRRFCAADIVDAAVPVTSLERAVIDAAVWSPDVRTATRIIVAAVQQRRTSPARLRDVLDAAGAVRFRRVLLAFLADLDGGAEALSEVAFLRWCRRHGLPRPRLQVRVDHVGRRRYLDAVFDRPGRRPLLVEVDGGVHLTLTARWRDTAKDNDATLAGETTLRFPSVAIYTDDPIALSQIRAALGATCQRLRVS